MQGGIIKRLIRWGLALALLPLNLGLTWALSELVRDSVGAARFWVPLSIGVAVWLFLYNTCPRPMWLYVFGHELTHALCALCCGAKIQSFKVGRRGGEVRLSKSNTFIALAPYFLPLYALLWSLFLILIRWWFGASDWFGPLLYAGLGIAYSFHVTLTVVILRIRQPDLVGEGFFFSGTLIWFGNAIVLLVALPLLTGSSGVAEAIRLAAWRSLDVFRFFCRWIQ